MTTTVVPDDARAAVTEAVTQALITQGVPPDVAARMAAGMVDEAASRLAAGKKPYDDDFLDGGQ